MQKPSKYLIFIVTYFWFKNGKEFPKLKVLSNTDKLYIPYGLLEKQSWKWQKKFPLKTIASINHTII